MSAGVSTRKLRKMAIALPIADEAMDDLRKEFDDVEFVMTTWNELPQTLGDSDAVLTWRLDQETLEGATELRWIQSGAAGVENLLSPLYAERDILVTNASGINAPNIAEHVVAFMLGFARRLPWLLREQQAHNWVGYGSTPPVFELTGQTIALLGLGDIGLETARRAKALGMRVIGLRRRTNVPKPDNVDEVVALDDLDRALGEADHVVSCLPHTPNTRHMFDVERFAAMKSSAYFYNVGRGATVVQADLIEALQNGKIAGAGLDVTDPEPLPEDSPLWDMENVLITSHTSGYSPKNRERLGTLLAENIRRYRAGEELLNVVDTEAGY